MLSLIATDLPECKSWAPHDENGKAQRHACVFTLRGKRALPYTYWCHQYYARQGKYGEGDLPHPEGAPAGAWPERYKAAA
eukprot:6768101-Heterocapsa_arctica.AAC.1